MSRCSLKFKNILNCINASHLAPRVGTLIQHFGNSIIWRKPYRDATVFIPTDYLSGIRYCNLGQFSNQTWNIHIKRNIFDNFALFKTFISTAVTQQVCPKWTTAAHSAHSIAVQCLTQTGTGCPVSGLISCRGEFEFEFRFRRGDVLLPAPVLLFASSVKAGDQRQSRTLSSALPVT